MLVGMMGGGMMGSINASSSLREVVHALGLTSGLKLLLDAGDNASYASGQKWLDLSGGGYDFNRGSGSGSDSADPTFNGVAGGRSSSEYWSFDGGDYFTYDSSNESWMESLHKDGAIFAWAAWVYRASGSSLDALFGDCIDGGPTRTGIRVGIGSLGSLAITVRGGAAPNGLLVSTSATVPTGQWTFLAGRLDEAANAYSMIIDGTTESGAGAYASPSSGAASDTFCVASNSSVGIDLFPNGSRMAALAIWEGTAPSAAALSNIRDLTRGKFGV